MTVTAILVDGAYYLKRYRWTYGQNHSPQQVAKNLFTMCIEHLDHKNELYRILFYDCPPLSKKAHNPVSGKSVDFAKTETFVFRTRLHKELVKLRKVALRRGRLSDGSRGWIIRSRPTKQLLNGVIASSDLTESDVEYDVSQKGVDMKIGLDIASLAHKRLVGRIVLVAGDADFVPAAKFARREGIDVVLDPMWQAISPDLQEHIDGLRSVCPRPIPKKNNTTKSERPVEQKT